MGNGIQEFFVSEDSHDDLKKKLLAAGFKKSKAWVVTEAFLADGTFVNLQRRPMSDFSDDYAGQTDERDVFVLELDDDLDKFSGDHPVRKFFGSLENPVALGNVPTGPKYTVDQYLPPQ